MSRLKEDIIKILAEVKKFGVLLQDHKPSVIASDSEAIQKNKTKTSSQQLVASNQIHRYTDKMYSPDIDATYPDFTPQHFSPNRQE